MTHKQIAISQAIIDTAATVVKELRGQPPPPASIPFAIAAGVV